MASDSGKYKSTFIDALYAKYCDDRPVDEVELEQKNGTKRVTEYVGFDKLMDSLKNVANLQYIVLPEKGISRCGEINLDRFTPFKAHTLDLSFNKLSNWQEVTRIVQLTKCLSELILTSNPLPVITEEEIETFKDTFDTLREVVLGDLGYSWSEVCQCALLWPNIVKLNLFGNHIVTLAPVTILQNLTYLSFSTNGISNWEELCKIGSLPRLNTLELSHCKINLITFPDVTELSDKTSLFPELEYLDLTSNQIRDWMSVAQLNRLGKLTTLLLKKNPIYGQNQYYYSFNHVISRIASLRTLDREPVTKTTREDAEKYYLRTIYLEYQSTADPVAKKRFLEENPCFSQLIDKYGEPVVAKTLSKQDKIKQNFSTLKIADIANPDKSKRHIEKQVPVSTKVSNLKFILRRLLKIDIGEDFDLIIRANEYEETMQDRSDISTYRVDDEDHLINVIRM